MWHSHSWLCALLPLSPCMARAFAPTKLGHCILIIAQQLHPCCTGSTVNGDISIASDVAILAMRLLSHVREKLR
jgi:hypothetical protein